MKKEVIAYKRGQDIYKVTEVPNETNKTALLDFCDRNNWGGEVMKTDVNEFMVTVYTD